ncbi:hypothetical protein MMC11_008583 [Xylographa trunciseda]|nr:hypothetical protein [Xylographa trunciseda]
MASHNKPLTASLRHPSTSGSFGSSSQSSLLVTRINEKKVELENLKQLKDLSSDLATQMQALEQKLATLSDGTEVAAVLANWHNVLRAINMASMKLPKPKGVENGVEAPLPQTLVRIPSQLQEI